jgi:hypothetical protein
MGITYGNQGSSDRGARSRILRDRQKGRLSMLGHPISRSRRMWGK